MDSMSYRNNRPPSRQQPEDRPTPSAPAVAPSPVERKVPSSSSPKPKKRPLIVAAIVVVVVVAAVLTWFLLGRSTVASTIDSSKYQVVVLKDATGTPNYFGKLSVVNDGYMKLSNVFYLQKKANSEGAADTSVEAQSASDFELIKLGNEIHGPEDEMIIPVSQILYFENLKSDGTVSKTIAEFQSK